VRITQEQYDEIARYHAWAKKMDETRNVAARTAAAFKRRGRVIRALGSLSISSHGPLEQLTAFPTAVFNPQLGEWQLSLPERRSTV